MQTDSTQAAHELGDASFYLHDYHFRQDNHNGICTLQPQNRQGYGNIYQVQPTDGLFLSTGSWIPYASMERKYEINQKLVKIYYLESGGVTLIQNGRKAQPITEGIHLYLNKPSQGRVLYQPNIPISYASVLLFEDYIEKNLQDRFTPDDFDYAEVYDWKAFDYNTPEIGTLFLQIRDKLIAGETSRLYYESKVGELLSIVAGNFHKQRQEIASKQQPLSKQEKKALESVRQAIEQNVLNPPEVSQLCKIAGMAHDGYARAIRPVHTANDGDSIYAVSLGDLAADQDVVGALAARVMAEAILRAVHETHGRGPDDLRIREEYVGAPAVKPRADQRHQLAHDPADAKSEQEAGRETIQHFDPLPHVDAADAILDGDGGAGKAGD